MPAKHCLLISDFTIQPLASYLADDAGGDPVEARVAPFGQVTRTLLDESSEQWRPPLDVAVVWTRPESAIPSFGRLMEGENTPAARILSEVDEFAAQLRAAARRVPLLLVPAWTQPAYNRGLGLLQMRPGVGPGYSLQRMNLHLAETLAGEPNIYILDAQRWVSLAGKTAANPKLWLMGKIAMGPEVFQLAAGEIRAALRAVAGKTRKLVLLDLDDTLWGGIVGDVGWENLVLGGHDPAGESFAAFQRALLALTRRGVVLGIVSKNTESVALEAIDNHPEMILRREHFAGWRINWSDKAENAASLVAELNLGLDSAVFIDDNPAERARVREALPDVLVPEWPKDKLLYAKALAELDCFDAAAISAEDRERAAMYAAERGRSKPQGQTMRQWLDSLELCVTAENLNAANQARAVQLLNKTNQMNLATRRMTEAQYLEWARHPDHFALVFRVADRFGDYGLTGLASLARGAASVSVEDFVLSCRVMGRGVERAILAVLAREAARIGASTLELRYAETPRNAPCKAFLDESGLERSPGGVVYRLDLAAGYAAPDHLRIVDAFSGWLAGPAWTEG